MTPSSALAGFLWLLLCGAALALPPKPARYVNDYANVLSSSTESTLENRLKAFERASSSQIVLAIFQELEQGAALEDFTYRTAESWGVGQAKEDNGAILFLFIDERKIRIEVGYGLEGAIPDITAKRIIENEIKPALKRGDYDAGVTAGAGALIQAAKGEYTGTGSIASDRKETRNFIIKLLLFILLWWLLSKINKNNGGGGGRVYTGGGTFTIGGGSWGGGSFGGGGGFSGGGGGFGGGGASGGW